MAEVVGSSPTGSTSERTDMSMEQVGAHQFRNHFGWYMERAAAGEEFLVTRRGKPCVRLVPARPRLPITEGDV
jgi:prevent-host-death family protein